MEEKIIFSEVEEVDYNLIEKSPKLDAQYVIDEMFESNKMIKIRGWIYNRNVNTRKVKPKLLLISEDKKICYRINTCKEYRPDLGKAKIGKGSSFAGFVAVVDNDKIKHGKYILNIVYGNVNVDTGECMEFKDVS